MEDYRQNGRQYGGIQNGPARDGVEVECADFPDPIDIIGIIPTYPIAVLGFPATKLETIQERCLDHQSAAQISLTATSAPQTRSVPRGVVPKSPHPAGAMWFRICLI